MKFLPRTHSQSIYTHKLKSAIVNLTTTPYFPITKQSKNIELNNKLQPSNNPNQPQHPNLQQFIKNFKFSNPKTPKKKTRTHTIRRRRQRKAIKGADFLTSGGSRRRSRQAAPSIGRRRRLSGKIVGGNGGQGKRSGGRRGVSVVVLPGWEKWG